MHKSSAYSTTFDDEANLHVHDVASWRDEMNRLLGEIGDFVHVYVEFDVVGAFE